MSIASLHQDSAIAALRALRIAPRDIQRGVTGSAGHHMGAALHAGNAVDHLETAELVDARSDAHFKRAGQLAQQIASEYPQARWLALQVIQLIGEGLRLDAIEGEHATSAKAQAARAGDEGRSGAALCESVALLFAAASDSSHVRP